MISFLGHCVEGDVHHSLDKVKIDCPEVPFFGNTLSKDLHVITDHQPLVSLFRKSLVDSSPRLTRMLIQLLDYTLEVTYQPGAQIHLSDAISRLSTHDNSKGTTVQNLDISMHAIEK